MQEAAVKLLHMEYLDLGVKQRVALLTALTSMALTCEPIREHISAQAEALAAPSRKVRRHITFKMRFRWFPSASYALFHLASFLVYDLNLFVACDILRCELAVMHTIH